MLLSSALSCDGRAKALPPRLSSLPANNLSTAFEDAPMTPPCAGASATLYSTCRALQSLLMTPSSTPPSSATMTLRSAGAPDRLSSPIAFARRAPTTTRPHGRAAPPTFKIRKARKQTHPPRGVNKRRRSLQDDSDSEADGDTRTRSSKDQENAAQAHYRGEHRRGSSSESSRSLFSTPKRQRLVAPPELPRGLARADFDNLGPAPMSPPQLDTFCNNQHSSRDQQSPFAFTFTSQYHPNHDSPSHSTQPAPSTAAPPAAATSDDFWTTDDDHALVQLVLEKFKLSSTDWVECAKTLGKDKGSVGRRWKSLVGDGSVGIRGGILPGDGLSSAGPGFGSGGKITGKGRVTRKGRAGLDMRSTL